MIDQPLKVGDKIKCIQNVSYVGGKPYPLTIGKIYEIVSLNMILYKPHTAYNIIWDDSTTFTFMIGSDAAKFFFEMAPQTTEIDYLNLIKGY